MFKYLINTAPYAYIASDMITKDQPFVVMWSRRKYSEREISGLVSSIIICIARAKKLRTNKVKHGEIIDALVDWFNFRRDI